jgi:hypothetical protein
MLSSLPSRPSWERQTLRESALSVAQSSGQLESRRSVANQQNCANRSMCMCSGEHAHGTLTKLLVRPMQRIQVRWHSPQVKRSETFLETLAFLWKIGFFCPPNPATECPITIELSWRARVGSAEHGLEIQGPSTRFQHRQRGTFHLAVVATLSLRNEGGGASLVLCDLMNLVHLAVFAVRPDLLRARHHRQQLPP